MIIDDFNALQCCNDAVDDFRRHNGITSTPSEIDPGVPGPSGASKPEVDRFAARGDFG